MAPEADDAPTPVAVTTPMENLSLAAEISPHTNVLTPSEATSVLRSSAMTMATSKKPTTLLDLPTELLRETTSYLDVVSRSSLALSCKTLLSIIDRPFHGFRPQDPLITKHHVLRKHRLLKLLQKDLYNINDPQSLLLMCWKCHKLHPMSSFARPNLDKLQPLSLRWRECGVVKVEGRTIMEEFPFLVDLTTSVEITKESASLKDDTHPKGDAQQDGISNLETVASAHSAPKKRRLAWLECCHQPHQPNQSSTTYDSGDSDH